MQAGTKGQFEPWSPGYIVKHRYMLREKIGEGGFGSVFQARHKDQMDGKGAVI